MRERAAVEKPFPLFLVGDIVVGFDATAGEEYREAIRDLGIRNDVSVGRHDSFDRAAYGLVRSIWEIGKIWLDCEGSNNTKNVNE